MRYTPYRMIDNNGLWDKGRHSLIDFAKAETGSENWEAVTEKVFNDHRRYQENTMGFAGAELVYCFYALDDQNVN